MWMRLAEAPTMTLGRRLSQVKRIAPDPMFSIADNDRSSAHRRFSLDAG
jgi:hypothetical protein